MRIRELPPPPKNLPTCQASRVDFSQNICLALTHEQQRVPLIKRVYQGCLLCSALKDPGRHLGFQNSEESKNEATCFTAFDAPFISLRHHRTLSFPNFQRGGQPEEDGEATWVRAWRLRPDSRAWNPSKATRSLCDTGTRHSPRLVLSFPHLQSVDHKGTYLVTQKGCKNQKDSRMESSSNGPCLYVAQCSGRASLTMSQKVELTHHPTP